MAKAKTKEKEKQLIKLIHEDKKLTPDEKMMYAAMADLYLTDLKDNLNRTSIELNEKYCDMTIDEWREFLTVPVIRKYIQGFKDEQISIMADAGLMEGNKDAVNIKKVVAAQGPIINNSNIVLIRLPDKVDFNIESKDVTIEGI